jgi:heme exporter protein B
MEEERGTTLLLQLSLRPSQVLAGKLLFNAALTLALALFAGAGFRLLIPVPLTVPALYWTSLALGALGISAATTILSAVIARARAAGPLLPVLAFPVLVPILLPVVALTELASGSGTAVWLDAQPDLVLLAAYTGLLVSLSFVLFDHVWRD